MGKMYYRWCSTRRGRRSARLVLRLARRLGFLREFRTPWDALTLPDHACAGLMHLWRRIHWSSGDGMMPPRQLLAVYRLAVDWPARGDIVELGAWIGLTTCYLATACRVRDEGRVYAVDTFRGTREGGTSYPSIERFGGSTLSAFREQLQRADVADLVTEIPALTPEAAGMYTGAPVRFLLIDADHSYKGVRSDFEAWWPRVAPNGLIVFHDYDMPEVARCVDEIRCDRRAVVDAPGLIVENVYAVTKRACARNPPPMPRSSLPPVDICA